MTTPVRIGGPTPQLIPSTGTSTPARTAFSARLSTPAAAAPAGLSGGQVVKAALASLAGPGNLVGLAAGIVGGPATLVAGAANLTTQASEEAKTMGFLAQVKAYILTNAIFEAANMPVVERDLS